MTFEFLGIHVVPTTSPIPLILIEKLDTIMSVSIGVNLALGVLRGLQDAIEGFFEYLKEYLGRMTISLFEKLVKNGHITEDEAFDKAKKFRNKYNIQGVRFNTFIRRISIFFAILVVFFCFCILYVSAVYPDTKISHVTARFMVAICVSPFGFFIASIILKKVYDLVFYSYIFYLKINILILLIQFQKWCNLGISKILR